MDKAVFFDRDNTLVLDKNYMHKVEDLKFYDDTFSALKSIQDKGFKLFIVTNQSGIGRGYFKVEDMKVFHSAMLTELNKHNIKIEDINHCPHSPDDKCDCRKPHPKMILDLSKDYNIDLSKSYMIGDKLIDAECGHNSGCTGVLLKIKDSRFKSYDNLSDFACSL
jgi:D-glycero-D-manno-heptose 1,7-bisphosphate phosphatase